MFAPKVAKAQTITTETPTNKLAPQPSALVSRPFGRGMVEQAHRLHGSIGNQGMLRLMPQRVWSQIDNQLNDVPDLSRGFGKPPLFPTDTGFRWFLDVVE
jgi:hypothetical protein